MVDEKLKHAVRHEDPFALAEVADIEQIERLKVAEELFEKRYQRRRRSSRLAVASQALVGYVALAGFFANAYQNYNNKLETQRRADEDSLRWSKEFNRAQEVDKYRAFFETAALVTDNTNADKRLVGYALLKEFVDDKTYNSKAALMLEESLASELRNDTSAKGLDEEHKNAIIAIVSALAYTGDCEALAKASRSIDKLAKHEAGAADAEEGSEVFTFFVRKIFGRGIEMCTTSKDFRKIRQPLSETLMRVPRFAGDLGSKKSHLSRSEANTLLVTMLRDTCRQEMQATGVSNCADIWKRYDHLCTTLQHDDPSGFSAEIDACQVMRSSEASIAEPASQPASQP